MATKRSILRCRSAIELICVHDFLFECWQRREAPKSEGALATTAVGSSERTAPYLCYSTTKNNSKSGSPQRDHSRCHMTTTEGYRRQVRKPSSARSVWPGPYCARTVPWLGRPSKKTTARQPAEGLPLDGSARYSSQMPYDHNRGLPKVSPQAVVVATVGTVMEREIGKRGGLAITPVSSLIIFCKSLLNSAQWGSNGPRDDHQNKTQAMPKPRNRCRERCGRWEQIWKKRGGRTGVQRNSAKLPRAHESCSHIYSAWT